MTPPVIPSATGIVLLFPSSGGITTLPTCPFCSTGVVEIILYVGFECAFVFASVTDFFDDGI